MKVLVVADGEVPGRPALDAAWPGWADGIELVIAADGGAERALRLGFAVGLLVGDMDSLAPARVASLRDAGVETAIVPAEKDESDAELALLAAVERGASEVVVLGAFGGGRIDHALANVALLAHPALAGRDVRLLDGASRVSALVAPDPAGRPVRRALAGRVGDLVSLLPLVAAAEGVVTDGLRYRLAGETLALGPARGLSNLRTAPVATVELARGVLAIVETTSP